MVRDLVELAIGMIKSEEQSRVRAEGRGTGGRPASRHPPAAETGGEEGDGHDYRYGNGTTVEAEYVPEQDTTREKLRRLLREGRLDGRFVELEVTEVRSGPMIEIFSSSGMEDMGLNVKDMLGNLFPEEEEEAGEGTRKLWKSWSRRRRSGLWTWTR